MNINGGYKATTNKMYKTFTHIVMDSLESKIYLDVGLCRCKLSSMILMRYALIYSFSAFIVL